MHNISYVKLDQVYKPFIQFDANFPTQNAFLIKAKKLDNCEPD